MSPRWKRIGKTADAAAFLRAREGECVAASARFLRLDRNRDRLWEWREGGEIQALILYHHRTLFPVMGSALPPPPRFLEGFLRSHPPHAIQGLRGPVQELGALLAEFGYSSPEVIDYDLMALDREPPGPPPPDLPALVLRKPRAGDEDQLFALHAAYEQEETLPQGAVFSPAACRAALGRILSQERVLVAETGSRIVGKINTNAASFSRFQIGGVYVRPEYRGQGIGLRMSAAFARELLAGGRSLSLFVKKRNTPARTVYRRSGFQTTGDYRISYLEG